MHKRRSDQRQIATVNGGRQRTRDLRVDVTLADLAWVRSGLDTSGSCGRTSVREAEFIMVARRARESAVKV